MNSDIIKASVASYFRYKIHCPLVCFERALHDYSRSGNPDVLCVTKDRRLIETEVKVSLSDLKNDIKKRKWQFVELDKKHDWTNVYSPYKFYYAVPEGLLDKAKEVILDWRHEDKVCGNAGTLRISDNINAYKTHEVMVDLACVINKKAPRLSIKAVIKMVQNQTGTLCSLANKLAKINNINVDDFSI